MGILGKPEGIFDLNDSDKSVGSYLMRQDIKEILKVDDTALQNIKFVQFEGFAVVDERTIQKLWYQNEIPNAPASRVGNSIVSLDELILIAIIKKTLPNALIEQQVTWGRKKIDIKISFQSQEKFIEFYGPGHFTQQYGFPENPFIRKDDIEKEFKIECILFPYWVQRCSNNIKVIFDDKLNGFGALWSTEIHFGMFPFKNSAQIIDKITQRFNAVDNEGYGYFYGPNTKQRNNPEHSIIEKIKNGKKDINTILPHGYEDKNYWIPDKLK
jgi:hypothetical protein